jgi:hypothetical protein
LHYKAQSIAEVIAVSFSKTHNHISDNIRQIKSNKMRWAGQVARMGEGRNVYRTLVGKPKSKRQLGRPRRRGEDGINMVLREIGWGCRLDSSGTG